MKFWEKVDLSEKVKLNDSQISRVDEIKHLGSYINPLLHAIRNNGIRFFSFWNSKENVSNRVIPKKKFLICCE